jgi:hypothetical protein
MLLMVGTQCFVDFVSVLQMLLQHYQHDTDASRLWKASITAHGPSATPLYATITALLEPFPSGNML